MKKGNMGAIVSVVFFFFFGKGEEGRGRRDRAYNPPSSPSTALLMLAAA